MIDGRVLYPATGYLVLAWRALAKLEGQVFDQMPVCFENVHIHRATILPKTGKTNFPNLHYNYCNFNIFPGISKNAWVLSKQQLGNPKGTIKDHEQFIVGTVKLDVSIMPGTGDFEVCENGALVVSGRISVASEPVLQIPPYENCDDSSDSMRLKTLDVYKELRLRGYDYGPTFQGILDTNHAGKYAKYTS